MNAFNRRIWIASILLVAVLGSTLVASAIGRGPISILGDYDFTEENGVNGGSGTEDDPYVISNWQIDLGSDDLYGVRIENTTAHFLLRNVFVNDALNQDGAGIRQQVGRAGSRHLLGNSRHKPS